MASAFQVSPSAIGSLLASIVLLIWTLPNVTPVNAQPLPDAASFLEQALQHADPDGLWYSQNHSIDLLSKRPTGEDRRTTIHLDHKDAHFGMNMVRDGLDIVTSMEEDACVATVNGSSDYSAEQAEKYRLSCEGITRWRDYHGYMLGLPMILLDPGTLLDPEVRSVEFMGQDVLALKVTYEPDVGADTWYFYFHPSTHALVGCRFYHDESKNDGEYLTFEGEITSSSGIVLPRSRKWYYNNNDEFLGEDIIQSFESEQ